MPGCCTHELTAAMGNSTRSDNSPAGSTRDSVGCITKEEEEEEGWSSSSAAEGPCCCGRVGAWFPAQPAAHNTGTPLPVNPTPSSVHCRHVHTQAWVGRGRIKIKRKGYKDSSGNRQDQDTLYKGKKLAKNKEKIHLFKILLTLLVNKVNLEETHDSRKGLLLEDLEKLKCLVLAFPFTTQIWRKCTQYTQGKRPFLQDASLDKKGPLAIRHTSSLGPTTSSLTGQSSTPGNPQYVLLSLVLVTLTPKIPHKSV